MKTFLTHGSPRSIIVVGKVGTCKFEKAKSFVSEDPIIRYANEYDVEDNYSIDSSRGIIIQDAHHKPRKDLILATIRQYQGQVVLTSVNQKSVPKEIMAKCQIKRALGTPLRDSIKAVAPNSDEPAEYEMNIFELVSSYLKVNDRDLVIEQLKLNKPYDEQFITWVNYNIRNSKVLAIDNNVKRKWSQDYFWELLGYAYQGLPQGPRMVFPKRKRKPREWENANICKKIGLRAEDYYLINQLKMNSEFATSLKSRLSMSQKWKVGGLDWSPPKKPKVLVKTKQLSLEDY
jgi:hypothetical protein